ncbi:hypothetical protein J6590_074990 [Homalodisca vitripennis]|nr:hypothetical protein J6590_074990 [Homalodisca vitripennis]
MSELHGIYPTQTCILCSIARDKRKLLGIPRTRINKKFRLEEENFSFDRYTFSSWLQDSTDPGDPLQACRVGT